MVLGSKGGWWFQIWGPQDVFVQQQKWEFPIIQQKKPGDASNIFWCSPRKLGIMNQFWGADFSKGLVQPPRSQHPRVNWAMKQLRVCRRMKYYPVLWGLFHKPWNKDPFLNNQDFQWKVSEDLFSWLTWRNKMIQAQVGFSRSSDLHRKFPAEKVEKVGGPKYSYILLGCPVGS